MEFWQWAAVATVLSIFLIAAGLFAIAAAIGDWTKAWVDEPTDEDVTEVDGGRG